MLGEMSMPPSNVVGVMDEEAAIEAEIQLELENLNLDHNVDLADPDNADLEGGWEMQLEKEDSIEIPNELESYIKSIQDQSNRFEQELLECDLVLNHSKPSDVQGLAVIPYDDQTLLTQLARDRGCTVEEYQRQILEEIENDEVVIVDELAEFLADEPEHVENSGLKAITAAGEQALGKNTGNDETAIATAGGSVTDGDVKAITSAGEQALGRDTGNDETAITAAGGLDGRLEVEIEKALEQGVDRGEIPVSRELVPVSGEAGRSGATAGDLQQLLREQLERLETKYQQRINRIQQDEACRRDEEEVSRRRTEEERQWRRQELEREEQKLQLERQAAQRETEKQEEELGIQLEQSMKKFQAEMAALQAETDQQRREHESAVAEESHRQAGRCDAAARSIQRIFRGYRVRKSVAPALQEKRDVRKKQREEERIKEVEVEIEKRKEEQKISEEKKREKEEQEKREEEERKRRKKEEEEEKKRKKEEEKRQKELEKKQREEEKQRQKEEEERRKQEEKKRKEEEKQRKKEEERKKKEEEKRKKEEEKKKKEEEKKRKEEEEQMKKEEKRLQEENAKKKEEDLKKQLEEGKNKKEEEKKETEERKEVETVEEKNLEISNLIEEKKDAQDSESLQENVNVNTELGNIRNSIEQNGVPVEENTNKVGGLAETDKKYIQMPSSDVAQASSKSTVDNETKHMDTVADKAVMKRTPTLQSTSGNELIKTPRAKTPRSARRPKPPVQMKPDKHGSSSAENGGVATAEKADSSDHFDSLPANLEQMRLQFIQKCLPWSKVANEPWKLRAGVSKRPLRRPSSAKKLPLLAENIILEAARVASLKQVTTVQLSELPGTNMSSLGQCWGLRYLSLTGGGLVAIDGLSQCKQLQYLDARNNKIEFVDLKDIGALQYLNLSGNRLTSLHGLDNCTNLRWLDLSHNNITRLGGLETLRHLCCLRLGHNQLLSTAGLGATPTLQMMDASHNHLQAVEDLDKLGLLVSLDLSANNLLQVPQLTNQVLLQELLLGDNSLSTVADLATTWLPLLNKLVLSQNSLEELPELEACLLLRELDVSNNQLLDPDLLQKSVNKCLFLEVMNLEENPISEDLNEGFYEKLRSSCPRLTYPPSSSHKSVPIKPRNSFETMCLTQAHSVKDIMTHFENRLRCVSGSGQPDLAQQCDVHYKFCEKLFNTLVEHRYAHEYGEVTVPLPSAPKTPRSGRPQSSRQKEKFLSPKDLFENALNASSKTGLTETQNSAESPKDLFESALKASSKADSVEKYNGANPKDLFDSTVRASDRTGAIDDYDRGARSMAGNGSVNAVMNNTSDPRALFDQALRSTESGAIINTSQAEHLTNGDDRRATASRQPVDVSRGRSDGQKTDNQAKLSQSAIVIQAAWRGYRVWRLTLPEIERRRQIASVDGGILEKLHVSAVKIQALWRGYSLRKKLLAALEYAQYDWGDDDIDDQDDIPLDDEFDVDKFLDFDENQLDSDWKPPETPDIPASHAVLRKPPSGKPRVPPIPTDPRPPSNPRRAWRTMESPLSDYGGRVPHPPPSVASCTLTARSGASKKEEKISEEWGFKDSSTAHLMMQRAKKMKYNAERRKKIKKLDPKQRLALFRKLEEVTGQPTYQVPQQKTLPRKEYFQARQEEVNRQEQEKREEFHTRVSRTFEWLHTQVGDHPVSDSVINQKGPRYAADNNLPELQGGRVQLVSSPSLELQSVDSASTSGQRARRFSAGSGGMGSKLPPIPQTISAPTPHVKERMSFRNPKSKEDIGWGGGRKRTNRF